MIAVVVQLLSCIFLIPWTAAYQASQDRTLHRQQSLGKKAHVFPFHIMKSFILALCCCSVTQLYLHDPMDCSTPGFPVLHQLPELAQTHVCRVCDAIQPSHPLSFPSPPALNLPQHQGLFQQFNSSQQVAKILELQLQYQSFQ